MPKMVVEIHVPLLAAPGPADNEYPFPWIDDVQEFPADLDEQGDVQEYDDGEEDGSADIFFITGSSEIALLGVAFSEVAALDRVPAGAFCDSHR